MRVRRLLILACSFAMPLAFAAQRYEGVAYIRGSSRIAYRETDWLTSRGGVAQRLVLYRCPDGVPFARKRVTAGADGTAPAFEFEDARDGYREGVRSRNGSRQVFVQTGRAAPEVVRPLPPEPGGVIDAGFDAFVRAHWQELAAGQSRRIAFLIPERFEFLDFEVAGARAATLRGRPVRELKMRLSAWYGFALPSIELAYDPNGERLLQYQGIGTIRDASGHNQDVRIEFPIESGFDEVPDPEMDRAAAAPLTARCSD